MDVASKVAFLSDPAAHGGVAVEARETRMSWVFLTPDRVYKLKKPVRYPYLDFSTQGRRHHFCDEELRLNRHLAPATYLEVIALRRTASGALTITGKGRAVDWLVVMRRLPADEMLDARIVRRALARTEVEAIAGRMADFYAASHAGAADGEAYLHHLKAEQAINRQLLSIPELRLAQTARPALDSLDRALERHQDGIRRRVAEGLVVEGHGDLRPEHVCLCDPMQIIDRLDFSRAMRIVDPYDEINYLGLECEVLGAAWVRPLLNAVLARRLGHPPVRELLAVYGAFRALLRARLSIAHLLERPVRKPEKWEPLARRYLDAATRECVILQDR